MSLIDLASLVLAPTAVKDGKVYNAIPNDQDFTFSRGTEATRVNSAGLIEKARTNLLLQSNTFNTTWTTGGLTETSGQSGYDGSSDAWLVENVAAGSRFMTQTGFGLGVATCSIYAKAGTTDWIYFNNGAGVSAYYDLTNGVLGATSGVIDANIESIGSGWYRCSMTASSMNEVRYYLADSNNSLPTSIGDNVYFQDAQLEQGLVATDYIETTTSSVTVGITDDLPRVDYSGGGCPSLLLEGSRANLLEHSEYFDSYTLGDVSIAVNDAISPEGLQNAVKITEDTTNARHRILKSKNLSTSNNDVSTSIFMKAGTGRYGFLEMSAGSSIYTIVIDLQNGTITDETGNVTKLNAQVESLANGWYRCSITITGSSSITSFIQFGLAGSATPTYNNYIPTYLGTGEYIYAYGAQIEDNASYPSSYIPTYGTSTSRSADTCSLTGASNLIGQSEGTLFAEFEINGDISVIRNIVNISNGTTTDFVAGYFFNDLFYARIRANNGSLIDVTKSGVSDGLHKVAIAYADNDLTLYLDGALVGQNTSASVAFSASLPNIAIGTSVNFTNELGDGINQAILFPTRLTNDQLQELTK